MDKRDVADLLVIVLGTCVGLRIVTSMANLMASAIVWMLVSVQG